MFGFIVVVVIIIVVVYKVYQHSVKSAKEKEEEAFRANWIRENRISVFGGNGELPYRSAIKAPETHLRELVDLIDKAIKQWAHYEAIAKFADEQRASVSWWKRANVWRGAVAIQKTVLDTAFQDHQNALEYLNRVRELDSRAEDLTIWTREDFSNSLRGIFTTNGRPFPEDQAS